MAVFAISCICVFAQEQTEKPSQSRYSVFSMKKISAQQAKKYLADANIGTVSQLPNSNNILVTASQHDLLKAAAIIRIVDIEQPYVIKTICRALDARELPSNESIAAEVGDIAIGTFLSPPANTDIARAIIDIHGDSVIAVVPQEYIAKITKAIEYLQKEALKERKKEKATTNESESSKTGHLGYARGRKIEIEEKKDINEVADSNKAVKKAAQDELFNNVLNVLEDANKAAARKAAEKIALKVETNEPNVAQVVIKKTDVNVPVEGGAEKGAVEKEGEKVQKEGEKIGEAVQPAKVKEAEGAAKVQKEGAKKDVNEEGGLYSPTPTKLAEAELELELPEKLNIVDLIDLVGKHLGLNYMFDATEIVGEVTLRVQGKIKVKELYPLLESALRFKGFVMTRHNDFVTITRADRVLDVDPTLVTDEEKVKYGDVVVMRIFKLKHIDTATAEKLLNDMKLGVNLTSIPETKTMFITGYAFKMPRIEELLKITDVPGKKKSFRFRQLKYTMANVLIQKITALASQMQSIAINVSSTALAATPPPTQGPRDARQMPPRPVQQQQAAAAPSAPATPESVYIDVDERTNRLLMIGNDEQLDVVESLVDILDVKKADLRVMRLYDIVHVDAEAVVEKLQDLGVIGEAGERRRGEGRRTSAATEQRQATPGVVTAAVSGAEEQPTVEQPQVIVVESTNSLLVNGTEEQHSQIATIVGYVDSERMVGAIPYVVYPLENRDPETLQKVLMSLIEETTVSEKPRSKEDKIQQPAETTTTKTRKIEENISIVPDNNSNSLIVYANKKNQEWVSSLIKQLDGYQPQVLLDVTLVEVTKNDEFKMDLDWVAKVPSVAGGVDMVTTFPDIAGGVINKKYSAEASTIGGEFTAFFAEEQIQMFLDLMDKKEYGRVLARPKLLANSNETGTIKTENKVFTIQQSTIFNPGSAAGTSTTSSSTNFVENTAGIELEIKPHITKGDQVRLDIKLMRTDFQDTPPQQISQKDANDKITTTSIPVPPSTLKSEVETKVTVPDKSTIILGGLEKVNQVKGQTKTPILGDLPLVGVFFRKVDNTDVQSRLYIFVKAHILRPGEEITEQSDIIKISKQNRSKFEKAEDKFQTMEDVPGIKPSPLDPVKVLEED